MVNMQTKVPVYFVQFDDQIMGLVLLFSVF